MHTRTHTHTVSDKGMGRAVKNSLEIIIKQVRLDAGDWGKYPYIFGGLKQLFGFIINFRVQGSSPLKDNYLG